MPSPSNMGEPSPALMPTAQNALDGAAHRIQIQTGFLLTASSILSLTGFTVTGKSALVTACSSSGVMSTGSKALSQTPPKERMRGADGDPKLLQGLKGHSACEAQGCCQPAGKVSAAPVVILAVIAQITGVVGVSWPGLGLHLFVILGAGIGVGDHRAPGAVGWCVPQRGRTPPGGCPPPAGRWSRSLFQAPAGP